MVTNLLTDCVNTNCAFNSAEGSRIAVLYSFRTLELLWGSFFFLYLFIYLFKSQKFPRMQEEEEEALGGQPRDSRPGEIQTSSKWIGVLITRVIWSLGE